MKRSHLLAALGSLLALALLLAGCPTTIYKAAVDERSIGDQAKDTEIKADIVAEFAKDDNVKALGISVYSFNRHVYLVGQKESEAEEKRAVEIAKNTEDVKSVTTYILPKKKGKDEDSCGTTNSLEITAKVKSKLIGDGDIWSTNVEVQTVQCNVVLLGIVGSGKEIDKSIAHAKSVEGVLSVKSYLVTAKAAK